MLNLLRKIKFKIKFKFAPITDPKSLKLDLKKDLYTDFYLKHKKSFIKKYDNLWYIKIGKDIDESYTIDCNPEKIKNDFSYGINIGDIVQVTIKGLLDKPYTGQYVVFGIPYIDSIDRSYINQMIHNLDYGIGSLREGVDEFHLFGIDEFGYFDWINEDSCKLKISKIKSSSSIINIMSDLVKRDFDVAIKLDEFIYNNSSNLFPDDENSVKKIMEVKESLLYNASD